MGEAIYSAATATRAALINDAAHIRLGIAFEP